jgi:hypothetical protein
VGLLLPAVTAYLGFRGWRFGRIRLRTDVKSWFLIGWLAIEVTAYFFVSPFTAARRLMGVTITGTMLAGRLVSLTARTPRRTKMIWAIAFGGVGIGALFAITDFNDARAEKNSLFDCVAAIRRQAGNEARIWFCGHWGFQYYGEREGLKTLYPGESELKSGDWLIYPDWRLRRDGGQTIELGPQFVEPIFVLEEYEFWPLRTVSDFYQGSPPIRRHDGPRLRATIYRVTNEFTAEPAESE